MYGATKAAVDSITRCMAVELGDHNIRVNAVNPTVVWTDMGASFWSEEKRSKPLLTRMPLHKFAGFHCFQVFRDCFLKLNSCFEFYFQRLRTL